MRINLINGNCETFRFMQQHVLLKHKDIYEAVQRSETRTVLQNVDQINIYSNNLLRLR
jgi:hypothetical protein